MKVVSMLTSYTQKRAETTNTGSRKQKKMGNAIECSDEQAISGLSECTFSQAVVESRI